MIGDLIWARPCKFAGLKEHFLWRVTSLTYSVAWMPGVKPNWSSSPTRTTWSAT